MRGVAILAAALAVHGCGGCPDIGCSHPLALAVTFPDASPDQPVSLVVEYDEERRFVSCAPSEACEVSCGNEACRDGEYDVVVTRDAGVMEMSIGLMSERASDGESSCRGAESVRIDVSRGRAQFETVQLEVEYERNDEYGGPGCGYADATERRDIALTYL